MAWRQILSPFLSDFGQYVKKGCSDLSDLWDFFNIIHVQHIQHKPPPGEDFVSNISIIVYFKCIFNISLNSHHFSNSAFWLPNLCNLRFGDAKSSFTVCVCVCVLCRSISGKSLTTLPAKFLFAKV
jgi:hypothetical protein